LPRKNHADILRLTACFFLCFTFGGVVVEVVVVDVEVEVDVVEELVLVEARLLVEVSSDVISAKVASGRPVVIENGSDSDGCVISKVEVSAIGISSSVSFKLPNVVPNSVVNL
jgi:hypothetical protein